MRQGPPQSWCMQGPALIANLNFEPEPRVIGMMRFDPDGKVWRGALPLAPRGWALPAASSH